MNFLRKFLGSSTTGEVASLPSGKLFLTRSPQSPKGEFECLYNDAYASIRQTTSAFYYQLCVTKVYQEGEDVAGDHYDSDDDDGFDSTDSLKNAGSIDGHSKDEWSFAIMEDLGIRHFVKADSTRVIAWKDINGDADDMFEFVVDEDAKDHEVDVFVLALFKCVYELKYRVSSEGITKMSQLTEFTAGSRRNDHGLGDLKKHHMDRAKPAAESPVVESAKTGSVESASRSIPAKSASEVPTSGQPAVS